MDKYILDYSDSSYFKGLKINIDYLQEGIDFASKKNIKDIAIWFADDRKKRTINFDFLKKIRQVEKLHVLVDLSKKSDINGLYLLNKIRDFRWSVGNDFKIDFAKLTSLINLQIVYSDLLFNWDKLVNLNSLSIINVKIENLIFLSGVKSLKKIQIRGGSLKSLKGLENCKEIEYVVLKACYKLIEVENILNKLPNLKGISIESCKNIDLSDEFISKWDNKLFIL